MSSLHAPIESTEGVQRRLGALASVAAAVSGAHELEEVLDVAAEQIRTTLGVSSVSISRWHLADGLLQTLINVGDLGPGEERWPAYETYDIGQFPLAHAMLSRGEPHLTSLADDHVDKAERELLLALGKQSCAAVPIVYEQVTWGEIYVTSAAGAPGLTAEDLQFLEAICSQLTLAIGRAERFSQLMDAAYRDALTGIANRRAFDEQLERSLGLGSTAGVGLLLGDIDGLKRLNDGSGHGVGDQALRVVGGILADVCGRGMRPARIGGDEFAVVIDGCTPDGAAALVETITRALVAADAPVRVSWGAAHSLPPHRSAAELVRAADQAQYATKRRRAPRAEERAGGRRAVRVPTRTDAEQDASVLALLAAGLVLLDERSLDGSLARCIALAELVAGAAGARDWWITTPEEQVVARSPPATAPAAHDGFAVDGGHLRLHWGPPSPGWAERAAATVTLLAREAHRPSADDTPPA